MKMHPIVVEQLVQARMDTLEREATAYRLAALGKPTVTRAVSIRELIDRAAGRVRLTIRSAAA
jgi:hypothetical protein